MGLAAAGYGLYETMTGGKAGGHALALGNGVLGSWLASVAVRAGQTLAEKRSGGPANDAPTLPGPVTLTPSSVQGLLPPPDPMADIDLQGPLREVLLTPDSSLDGDDFEGRHRRGRGRRGHGEDHGGRGHGRPMRRRMRRRMKRRFLRAQQDEQGEPMDEPWFDDETD